MQQKIASNNGINLTLDGREKTSNLMNKYTLGGILGPIVFTVVAIVAATMRPGYSHTQNFISELGATDAPNAAFMNYAGFVIGGLLVASLGFALIKILPRKRLTLVASVLVSLFGIGIATSGIISCDLGCPQGTGTMANIIHNTVAPIAFLCLIAASLIFGFRWRSEAGLRNLANYSLATGVVALGMLALLASSLEARELTGLWQRLLLLVLFSWCIIVSLRIGKSANE